MLAAAGKPDDVDHEMMVSEAVEETKTAVITESTNKEEISALTKTKLHVMQAEKLDLS